MNKSFKVVFNKARGALMVVNEVTSSVQAKGTKTVIVAAVASLVAGGAVAAETQWVDAPEDLKAVTTTQTWDKIVADGNNAFIHTATEEAKNVPLSFVSVTDEKTFNGTLWVTGSGAKAQASGFGVSGDQAKFTNAGTIYVTSGEAGVNYQNDAIWAGNGATAINTGKIVAKDAYGMRVGKTEDASHLVNKGEIVVESTGAGIELGGANGSDAVNEGSIVVGAVNEKAAQGLKFGHGVLIQDTTGVKFTNNGTIVAGEGASAIEVKKQSTSATITLGEKSKIVGDINLGTDTTVGLVVDGAKDKLSIKSAGITTVTVKGGADIELVDQKGSVYQLVDIQDGKLTASIWHDATEYGTDKKQLQNDNHFKAVTVGEKGVFNITKLNSGGDKDQTKADAKKHTQLLLSDMQLTLNGGALQVAGADYHGTVKIGDMNNASSLTISNGAYSFEKIFFGSANKVANQGKSALTVDSDLTVGTLDYTTGDVTVNNGDLTVGTLTWKVPQDTVWKKEGTLTVGADGVLTVGAADIAETGASLTNAGEIYTTYDILFKKKEVAAAEAAATPEYELTNFGKLLNGQEDTGTVFETKYTGKYTVDDIKAVAGDALSIKKFAFVNGQLVTAEKDAQGNVKEGNATWAEVKTLNFLDAANSQVDALPADKATNVDITLEGTKDITVGSFNVGEAKTAVVNATGKLTVASGDFFAGKKLETVTFKGNGTTLGMEGTQGVLNAAAVIGAADVAALVTVAGDVQANKGVTMLGTSSLDLNKDAALTSAWISGGTVKMNGATLGILGNKPVETTPAAKAVAEDEAADKAYEGAFKLETNIVINGGVTGNVIGLGADGVTAEKVAVEAFGEKTKDMNVYYVAKQLNNNTMAIDETYGVVVDLAGVAATAGFKAEEGVMAGALNQGDNGKQGVVKVLNLSDKVLVTDKETGVKSLVIAANGGTSTADVDFGTVFYGDKADVWEADTTRALAEGKVEVKADKAFVADVLDHGVMTGAVVNALNNVTFGQNQLVDAVVFGTDDYYKAANEQWAKIQTAMEEAKATQEEIAAAQEAFRRQTEDAYVDGVDAVSYLGVLGGAFSTAVDINNETAKVLNRRMSVANGVERAAQGVNVWADVVATRNEAKGLFGDNVGYEADIYGAAFGADFTASCGAILGAALTVGQADANSVGFDYAKVDNDVEYFGFSIYGAHQIGLVNGMFDIGYTSLKNELSTNTVLGQFKEDVDGTMFTVGLGAEYLAKAGSVNVVPHAGLRWTRVDLDDSKFGADYDAMNLFQMPIGVTFSGNFETAGWKLAPTFDLSVVPTFGDKDATADYGFGYSDAIRVVDSNPVQATLGVSAQTGAWTFGVNYGLTAGSDDRMNNSLNASARYTF